jgi:hypothetical protein
MHDSEALLLVEDPGHNIGAELAHTMAGRGDRPECVPHFFTENNECCKAGSNHGRLCGVRAREPVQRTYITQLRDR